MGRNLGAGPYPKERPPYIQTRIALGHHRVPEPGLRYPDGVSVRLDGLRSWRMGLLVPAVAWLAGSCTTIAGLDGDYQLGAGTGGTSTQAAGGATTKAASGGSSSESTASASGANGGAGGGAGSSTGGMMNPPVCGDGMIDANE